MSIKTLLPVNINDPMTLAEWALFMSFDGKNPQLVDITRETGLGEVYSQLVLDAIKACTNKFDR